MSDKPIKLKNMKNSMMIKNMSDYPMKDIYEYLAGYERNLRGKFTIKECEGKYYNTLYVHNYIKPIKSDTMEILDEIFNIRK
jgi:hypothetical protein